MKLLFLASHAWSEQIDIDDLDAVVAALMATLADVGPVQVHAPADRPGLVTVLRSQGFDPTTFTEEAGPPAARYDRGFFLIQAPLSDEMQLYVDSVFSTLADAWLTVHVPPGSTTAVVQRHRKSPTEPERAWPVDLDADTEDLCVAAEEENP